MSRKTRSQRAVERPCGTFWASHGCRKQKGHHKDHICSPGCPVLPADAYVNESGFAEWDDQAKDWRRVTVPVD